MLDCAGGEREISGASARSAALTVVAGVPRVSLPRDIESVRLRSPLHCAGKNAMIALLRRHSKSAISKSTGERCSSSRCCSCATRRAERRVREALAAAIQSADRFAGDSSVRTWLIGILKHKILDHFRRASREQPLTVRRRRELAGRLRRALQGRRPLRRAPRAVGQSRAGADSGRVFRSLERCMDGYRRSPSRV